ncbi:hypothetical protein Cch01nite_32130 [Cellulomonas chitinilytica]|uniref:Uncharacterized protein n=1 Tax=Cellulomonas chitinilytica TaxID=398759 RepID=A0A919P709_9CELL|nr:hypothetical protein [Cellulomonas chitinilytica]GIG22489.1 hypothetical protein Cch01nite_32130 [Cellulomonas chitinilytica]
MDTNLTRIADPSVDEATAVAAMGSLPPGDEPPSFWRDVAGDPALSPRRRALAVEHLLARHVRPGATTVTELAALLGRPAWLSSDDVDVIPWLTGELPVRWSDADTYLVVRLLTADIESYAVYLRLAGRLDGETARAAVLGEGQGPEAGATVLELGFTGDGAPPPVRRDEDEPGEQR